MKNKVAPPFREAEFDIMYGEGISRLGEVVDVGIELDIIDKAGAWFTVCGQRVQGKDAVKKYLAENPDKCAEVEEQIRQNFHKLAGTKDTTSSSASSDAKKAVDVSADDFSEDSFGDDL